MALSSEVLMGMNARGAAVALTTEIELTLRLIEQLPDDEAPTSEQVEDLRRVLERRVAQVDQEVRAVQAGIQGVVNAMLLKAERRAEG